MPTGFGSNTLVQVSIPVELTDLAERIEQFGSVAYLVTVNADGSPHVVSVEIQWDDLGRLSVPVGNRSLANADESPSVTLLWPAHPGDSYGLIVDGQATGKDGDVESRLAIAPTAAVLHRTPAGDPSSPSCIRVLERR